MGHTMGHTTEPDATVTRRAFVERGAVVLVEPEEARKTDASIQGTYGRPWELWKRKALAR